MDDAKAKATLIIHHVVTPGDPEDLLRRLLQMCTYHMDVKPLASGGNRAFSKEVHGRFLWCRVFNGSRPDGSTGRLC